MKLSFIKKTLGNLLVACGALWSITTMAGPDKSEICNKVWSEIIFNDQMHPDLSNKLRAWEAKAEECRGSRLYEFRLANLYTRLGQYTKAEQILSQGLTTKPSDEKELLIALADIELFKHNWDLAEKKLLDITQKYPNWYFVYQKLGVLKIEQGKPREAIEYLKKANEQEKHARTYTELAVAYHQLHNHQETVAAINAAFELDQSIVKDREAMLSAAMSYAALGKFEISKSLLGMLLKARPDMKDDPGLRQALLYLSERMKAVEEKT